MRKVININDNWLFTKDDIQKPDNNYTGFENVNIPHTWNNLDGQDGGSDFYRNSCWYKKDLGVIDTKGGRVFLEFKGVNSIATVYVNGVQVAYHEGGFSTFRADITNVISEKGNTLFVKADNRENDRVYPGMADFTFYGGIYRDVNLIYVNNAHFDLEYYGGKGIEVISEVDANKALVTVKAYTINAEGKNIKVEILDENNSCVAEGSTTTIAGKVKVEIGNPHLWHGVIDPYLYTAKVTLVEDEKVIDEVKVDFGIRTYYVDKELGFFLNGKPYHLHGVSRHQDREDKGWAISKADHEEDMKLICEVGATTIRLAHYQHDEYFYDLCDKYGQVIWAEIPFISVFKAEGRENTISQMKELIIQNINHPSICFWGISNEITIGGECEKLYENHKVLADLCKELDPTRLTTIAHMSMVEMESKMHNFTDVLSYNHYFGWYGGDVSQNGPWLDAFHAMHPDKPLGVSEYGAEGIIKYHTETPACRDYTEEYHAYYHEEMLKTFAARPYLWSTHVWNMFDFGSDMRDEGGVKGRNNKGLVTFDRKIKKDAFFAYKAFWSNEKFVHIAGRRFENRVIDKPTTIKVYSNCEKVVLDLNGKAIELWAEKIFEFKGNMLNLGENIVTARGYDGEKLIAEEAIILKGVEIADESYIFVDDDTEELEGGGVANWFDDGRAIPTTLEIKEGYFSVEDKFGEVMANPEAAAVLGELMAGIMSGQGMKINKGMMKMLQNFTFKDLAKMAGKKMPQGALFLVNDKLNKIKK